MSQWLNTETVLWKSAIKPCRVLGFCVYGQLVEEFPITEKPNPMSCQAFGHDCPVFYHAEAMAEDHGKMNLSDVDKFFKEMRGKRRRRK